MTFNELIATNDSEFNYLNSFLDRANIFAEATEREFEKNLSLINMRIITEDGTEEDRAELNDAAKESHFSKIKKFMSNLINTIVQKLTEIGNNIAQFFMQAKVKLALKILGSLSKKYPNKTIEIEELPDVVKFYEEYEAEFLKKIAEYRANGSNPIDARVNSYDDMMDRYYEEKRRKLAKPNIIKMTLSQAKDALQQFVTQSLSYIKQSASRVKDLVSIAWDKLSSSVAAMVRQGVLLLSKVAKEGAEKCWEAIKNFFTKIRNKAEGPSADTDSAGSDSDDESDDDSTSDSKDSSDDDKEDKSSDDDKKEDDKKEEEKKEEEKKDDEEKEESANLDNEIDNIMDYLDIQEEFIGDDSDIDAEEYYNTPEGYLEAMENELFDDEYDMYEESGKSNVDQYIDRLLVSLDY